MKSKFKVGDMVRVRTAFINPSDEERDYPAALLKKDMMGEYGGQWFRIKKVCSFESYRSLWYTRKYYTEPYYYYLEGMTSFKWTEAMFDNRSNITIF